MTTKLTQRIIGLVALIALAVIFVPFFLSDKNEAGTGVTTTEIPLQPPQPEFQIAQAESGSDIHAAEQDGQANDYEPTVVHNTTEVNVADENTSDPNATTSPTMANVAATNQVTQTPAAVTPEATATSTVPVTKTAPVAQAAAPTATAKPTVPAKTPATTAAATPKRAAPSLNTMKPIPSTAWVVQLASFSQLKNAEALQNKLRDNGFTAYTQQAKLNNATINRVFVGPFVARNTADAMLAQINQKLALQGIVVNYNPVS